MSGIKIKGTGHAVPSQVMTNADFSRLVETSDEWITSRTGIRQRHHCTQETHIQLCVQAAKQALLRSGISSQEIGVCIVATITPDTVVPSTACMLQKELGLSEDTLCFDLSAACSGFLFALHTAECLLHTAEKKHALIVGAEVLSRVLNWSDRGTCILFGDGAGAAIVESRADWQSISAVFGSRGDDQSLRLSGPGVGDRPHICMDGTGIFKFAVETVPKCIDQVLRKAQTHSDAVDFFVFHQANARIIDLAVRKYHIPAEKYYKNIDRYGNTSAASIPLVLSELQENGVLHSGSRVLLVGFGGGLTWGGALIEFA